MEMASSWEMINTGEMVNTPETVITRLVKKAGRGAGG
jgi:hypothetical protein